TGVSRPEEGFGCGGWEVGGVCKAVIRLLPGRFSQFGSRAVSALETGRGETTRPCWRFRRRPGGGVPGRGGPGALRFRERPAALDRRKPRPPGPFRVVGRWLETGPGADGAEHLPDYRRLQAEALRHLAQQLSG